MYITAFGSVQMSPGENMKPLSTDITTQSPLVSSIRLVITVELFQPAYLVRQVFDCELNV